jgi:hypothetical protein
MEAYTRSQVRDYRMKWINFLMAKGRRKARSRLDAGKGARCCLGHGCFVLGIKKSKDDGGTYYYDGEEDLPPNNFVLMVGMWTNDGAAKNDNRYTIGKYDFNSLAEANDEETRYVYVKGKDKSVKINISPRQIGTYLLSVIEGGKDTPFRPLTDYPE